MADGNYSLISLDALSKPATVLIEKIAAATGIIWEPRQIKRVAKAQAEAQKIVAIGNIETEDLRRRAADRWAREEVIRQKNIEAVIAEAIKVLPDNAKSENLDEDWVNNFFDRCRLFSDVEMQRLWAQLLAGEATMPGSFSKRTVNLVASLERHDAEMFSKFCSCVWLIHGEPVPVLFDHRAEALSAAGFSFDMIVNLVSLGLITFEGIGGFTHTYSTETTRATYGRYSVMLLTKEGTLNTGHVLLTQSGEELCRICERKYPDGVFDGTISYWSGQGHCPFNLWPQRQ